MRTAARPERDLFSNNARKIGDALLNLLFPISCLTCHRPVASTKERGICANCWNRLIELGITPPLCPSCGFPYLHSAEECGHLCGFCLTDAPPYSGARSYGIYRAELRGVLHAFKFKNRQDLAGVLGPLLASAFWANWFRKDVDLIVPVPLHAERERNRGFNQSALLAAELSRFLALPWKKNILRRIRNTKPQVGLSDTQRRVNMKNAFHCRDPRIVQDRRLLLIDDVMTTGATAASAAQALLQAGALRVSVLTAARTLAGFE